MVNIRKQSLFHEHLDDILEEYHRRSCRLQVWLAHCLEDLYIDNISIAVRGGCRKNSTVLTHSRSTNVVHRHEFWDLGPSISDGIPREKFIPESLYFCHADCPTPITLTRENSYEKHARGRVTEIDPYSGQINSQVPSPCFEFFLHTDYGQSSRKDIDGKSEGRNIDPYLDKIVYDSYNRAPSLDDHIDPQIHTRGIELDPYLDQIISQALGPSSGPFYELFPDMHQSKNNGTTTSQTTTCGQSLENDDKVEAKSKVTFQYPKPIY